MWIIKDEKTKLWLRKHHTEHNPWTVLTSDALVFASDKNVIQETLNELGSAGYNVKVYFLNPVPSKEFNK